MSGSISPPLGARCAADIDRADALALAYWVAVAGVIVDDWEEVYDWEEVGGFVL